MDPLYEVDHDVVAENSKDQVYFLNTGHRVKDTESGKCDA